LRETLLTGGDDSMHLADLKSYLQAQDRLGEFDSNQDAWAPKAILNVGPVPENRRATAALLNMLQIFGGVSPCPVQ
jgi:starch phosphorylase